MYYRAIKEWNDAGSVTVNSVNLGFFQKIDSSISSGTTFTVGTSDYSTLVDNVALAADKFFAVVQYHERSNGSMPEQFGREDGLPTGARDLTWSHASMISAARAKAGTPVY